MGADNAATGDALNARVRRAAELSLVLAAPSPAAHAADPTPAGRWYGEGRQPDGEYLQWLSHRRPDGTFEIEFRAYRHCRLEAQHRETGRWTYADGLYATTTLTVDGRPVERRDPFFRDVYEVERLDEREMRYRHVRTGTQFHMERVGDDFIFPACAS